jgi:hypothetical protein
MVQQLFVDLHAQGKDAWNQWGLAHPEAKIDFKNHMFSSKADFAGFVFHTDATFEGAIFANEADFTGAHFLHNARFSKARFAQFVTFDDVRFESQAVFDETVFDQAEFNGTEFKKLAAVPGFPVGQDLTTQNSELQQTS